MKRISFRSVAGLFAAVPACGRTSVPMGPAGAVTLGPRHDVARAMPPSPSSTATCPTARCRHPARGRGPTLRDRL